MASESTGRARMARTVASLAVIAGGLLAIVGSGGGAVGFPPCEPPVCSVPPPAPLPAATVTPAYVTVQVGAPVSWAVSVTNLAGPLSYQWLRRDAGAASYVEIPGATAATYGLAAVNLVDDGARFLVAVSNGSGLGAQAVAHLVVSATPGLVWADGEFLAQDWSVAVVEPAAPASAPVVLVERIETGGNPGAWRRASMAPGSGSGAAAAFFFSNASVYDPAASGPIKVLDHAQDCGLMVPTDLISAEMSLAIEQSGRRYVANTGSQCNVESWAGRAGRASLTASDFRLFDGPACGSGEACPDFSAGGAPLRFGYFDIVFSSPGVAVVHGVDNWRVTVWR